MSSSSPSPVSSSFQTTPFQDLIDIYRFDTDFRVILDEKIEESKDLPNSKTWFPTPGWKNRFCRRWNLKYNKRTAKTYFSKRELLSQIVPSLDLTYALRIIFNIPGGTGQIVNMDEPMEYMFNPDSKQWV